MRPMMDPGPDDSAWCTNRAWRTIETPRTQWPRKCYWRKDQGSMRPHLFGSREYELSSLLSVPDVFQRFLKGFHGISSVDLDISGMVFGLRRNHSVLEAHSAPCRVTSMPSSGMLVEVDRTTVPRAVFVYNLSIRHPASLRACFLHRISTRRFTRWQEHAQAEPSATSGNMSYNAALMRLQLICLEAQSFCLSDWVDSEEFASSSNTVHLLRPKRLTVMGPGWFGSRRYDRIDGHPIDPSEGVGVIVK
ncbi:hypothetical protein LX36DRAFT_675939 [Colletotrichum falcatum]|nr:hypothetical protein LX36DRAFT_675939 [Colletotrichum falcatum]